LGTAFIYKAERAIKRGIHWLVVTVVQPARLPVVTHTLWQLPRSNGDGKGCREAVACQTCDLRYVDSCSTRL
jgi:hypothetical protein